VDEIEVSTVIYLPPEEVYEFLVDFPRYTRYSKHLQEVRRYGDGSPGTEYDLRFTWWKLSYTARSRVTDLSPPNEIEWEVVKDLQATGYWRVDEIDPPEDEAHACRVWLYIEYDPHSAHVGALNLPRFVSLDWVVRKVKPLILEEAQRVVERIVADIEGRRRTVELTIHQPPDLA
jgi:uncharacterized membrane protein